LSKRKNHDGTPRFWIVESNHASLGGFFETKRVLW
jgi:hypothetical protein